MPRFASPFRLSLVPLRSLLTVPFVLQIVLTVGLVGSLSLRNGQQAVNELAIKLRQEISDRIDQRLDSYFATPRQLSATNLDALQLGLLDSQDLPAIGQFFWRQMQQYSVGYLLYGKTDGEFAGAGRYFEDGRITIDELSPQKYGTRHNYVYATDSLGNRKAQVDVNKNYSFQKEPWYANVFQTQKPQWTPVYQWETTPYPLAVAYSRPLLDRNQRIIGVVAAEQRLSQISDFLRQLKISPATRTFILERNGLLIASSAPEPPFRVKNGKAQRLGVQDFPDPLTRETGRFLSQQFPQLQQIRSPQTLQFTWQGQRHFVQVSPWQDAAGLDWLVVVAIPESDFMGQIEQNTQQTILLCIAALGMAIVLSWYTSNFVIYPILKLSKASQRIAQGDLTQTVEPFPIQEVQTLAIAFNHMALQLQESFSALERSNLDLEQRVSDRTQALSAALTSLQQTQTQLIQAEKMSSLGQVAAGIAHEINNPINFIHGNLPYVEKYMTVLAEALDLYQQQNLDLPSTVQTHLADLDLEFITQDLPKILQSMRSGSDRIREIVQGLRHFSQLDEAIWKQVDLHHGLDSTLLLLQHRLKASSFRPAIQINKEYGVLPNVECYAGQMNQVFLNILSNAIDAIDLQYKNQRSSQHLALPTIIIHTELGRSLEDSPLEDGEATDNITIRIIDNGIGIPATLGSKIFDPFFTTKPIGQGTGLGLATSYQIIVEQHQGSIEYRPHAPIGTEFILKIPLLRKARSLPRLALVQT
jgi:signal transduction histidine kinase